MPRVIIVGAGMTGLATAYWLNELKPALPVTILERARVAGGKVRSRRVGDFLLEEGPDSFLGKGPEMLELCRRLGLESRLVRSRDELAVTYMWEGHGLLKLAPCLQMGIPSHPWTVLMSPTLSPLARLRLALEGLVPKVPPGSASTASLNVEGPANEARRLEDASARRLVDPLATGLFSTTSGDLAPESHTRAPRDAGPAFYSFPDGMQELVEHLADLTADKLLTQVEVTRVERSPEGWEVFGQDGWSWQAEELVLALPSLETARLVRGFDPQLADSLGNLGYASGACVHLGLERQQVQHPLDGFGFVATDDNPHPLAACVWSSQKFPGRSEADHVLLKAFLRGTEGFSIENSSREDLAQEALESLRPLLGIAGQPFMTSEERYLQAFPECRLSHLQQLAELEARRRSITGLHWAGPAFGAAGIPECVQQGLRIAESITGVRASALP